MTNNACVNAFMKKVSTEVDQLFENRSRPQRHNLTKKENEAIKWLSENDNLIVGPADKGGAVVVISREKYEKEAYRQLNDTEYYLPLPSFPLENMKEDLRTLLLYARENEWISKQEFDFLLPAYPRLPCFRMLMKVHKDALNPPGRPIISSNDSISEPASKYVDYYIKPFVSQLPSYLQDTTHTLKKLSELADVGSCYLATMDIQSLYSNIVHSEGLAALKHYLRRRPEGVIPPTDFLLQLTEWTLKNNVFIFQDSVYRQQKGTAMGACFAPNYANLTLGLWEELYILCSVNPFFEKIKWYGRYIDDILFLFSGSEQELLDFHSYVNSLHSNLKLTLEFSKTEISFLDLRISINENGLLNTTIYRKSTDRNTILRADSFHPPSLINNIPFGQFQRLRRICDKQDDFEQKASDMHVRFQQRGYKPDVLDQSLNKVKSVARADLLRKTHKPKPSKQIYFVTQHSREAGKVKDIIKRNWAIIESDPSLRDIFTEPPSFSYRRAPTLNDKLVRSDLGPKSKGCWLSQPTGNFHCGHCNFCSHIIRSPIFKDLFSPRTYQINGFSNCQTQFLVYRLQCGECDCFYVGRTKRRFRDRLSEHLYAIRTANDKYPMAKHYKASGHTNPYSLKAQAIEVVPNARRRGDRLKRLLQRETFWIFQLRATEFPGLNEEIDYSPFL